jgi:hypothetical protein
LKTTQNAHASRRLEVHGRANIRQRVGEHGVNPRANYRENSNPCDYFTRQHFWSANQIKKGVTFEELMRILIELRQSFDAEFDATLSTRKGFNMIPF